MSGICNTEGPRSEFRQTKQGSAQPGPIQNFPWMNMSEKRIIQPGGRNRGNKNRVISIDCGSLGSNRGSRLLQGFQQLTSAEGLRLTDGSTDALKIISKIQLLGMSSQNKKLKV